MIGRFGMAVLLAGAAIVALPAAAGAQSIRNLDDVPSDVRIYTGEITTIPLVYSYTIPPQTVLTIDVIPSANSQLDPMVVVTDVATGEVLAEDDDGGEGVAAHARIFSEAGQKVEITVSPFGFLSEDESYGAFELHLRESRRDLAAIADIDFGAEVNTSLDEPEGRLFVIEGEEGQLLQVAMIKGAEDLDPFLEIYRGRGAEGDPLATNDDGGNDLNALLRFVFPETGTYTIRATSFEQSTYGDFTLRVADAGYAVLQSPQQEIALGDRLTGRLGEGYEYGSLDPQEIYYQLSEETIAAIRRGRGEVTVNMTTPLIEDEDFPSAVDAYLELGFETPLGYAAVMTDDDGGEGLNSRIAVDLSQLAGEDDWLERLRIRASSVSGGGQYEIELVEGMQEVEQPSEDGDFYDEFEELEEAPPIRALPDED